MGNSVVSTILFRSAVWDLGIQWGLYIVAAYLKTEKFFDLAGSGTFVLLALQSLRWGGQYNVRQKIQTGMVTIWGIRLGLFLFSRVCAVGYDRRFNKVRNHPKTFFIYWTIQALWIFVTLVPSLILNAVKDDAPLCTRDYIGWGMWTVGFLLETLADHQKNVFNAHPDNVGRFINTGLWSVSRHPNYFGEILLWSGLYISASSVMLGRQHLSVISPLFIWFLLTKVSGIPMLERHGMKRWGGDPEYLEYVKKVPILVPFVGRKS